MESVNNPIEEYDISHLRRGDPHPWKPDYVLSAWISKDGKRKPAWAIKESFEKSNGPVKWRNKKVYTDTVIIHRYPEAAAPSIVQQYEKHPVLTIKASSVQAPERIILNAWLSAKRRICRVEGLAFDLTYDTLPAIPEKCPILGIPLLRTAGSPSDFSPSLDRIIPSRGYVLTNVVWVSNRANRIKTDACWEEIKAVAEFYEKLCPNMRSLMDEKVAPLPRVVVIEGPAKKPEPPKAKILKSSEGPSEGVVRIAQEHAFLKERKEVSEYDRKYTWMVGCHYQVLHKEQNSWEIRKQKLSATLKSAFLQWETEQRYGMVYICPMDLLSALAELDPAVAKIEPGIFGALIRPIMQESPSFLKIGKSKGRTSYKFRFDGI